MYLPCPETGDWSHGGDRWGAVVTLAAVRVSRREGTEAMTQEVLDTAREPRNKSDSDSSLSNDCIVVVQNNRASVNLKGLCFHLSIFIIA